MNEIETPVSRPGERSPPHPAGPAARALAEAKARHSERVDVEKPVEIDGRSGPDPIRYGDWENKGIASDF